jgi:TolB-like protein/cytochrome c-type biogenesis protein CcmH/NrfG
MSPTRPMAKIHTFGPFRLDADAGILFRGTEPTDLGQRAVSLLRLLLERAGEPVSKDALIETAWPGLAIEDSNLTVQIAALRRAFEEAAGGAAWIETLPRRGYRYVGPAVSMGDPPAESNSLTSPALALPDKPSVAVLPFLNLSGDPEQEYFADGLTEDIITALSLWRSFPVIARNSTFVFKGKPVNIQEVGKALAARYVLEGSVRKGAARVRVAAQLVDCETGHHVWAEKFDRQLTDLFDLQDELTRKIAAVVTPEVERAEYRRLSTQRPQSLDAWHLVQRGTAELDAYTKEGNIRAREMCARALELDPAYSRALAGIALSYNRDLMLGHASSREEAAGNALKNARKAVTLDRSDSHSQSILGMAYIWSGQIEEARLSFQRSVELNPSNGYARASLGNALDLMGQSEEGIAMLEDGIRLNPDAPNMRHIFTFLARALICAHRYEDAVEWARRGTNTDPGNPNAQYLLAACLAHLGRIKEAGVALGRCERIQPGFVAARADWRPYKDSSRNEHILDGIRKVRRES